MNCSIRVYNTFTNGVIFTEYSKSVKFAKLHDCVLYPNVFIEDHSIAYLRTNHEVYRSGGHPLLF